MTYGVAMNGHIFHDYFTRKVSVLLFKHAKDIFCLLSEYLILKGMQGCPDYCVVLGDTYKEIRDDVAKWWLEKNTRVNLKV